MILGRGLGVGGPLVTAGLGLGAGVGVVVVIQNEGGSGSRKRELLLLQLRNQILSEDEMLTQMIVAIVTNGVLN